MTPFRLLLSTTNRGKLRELREILAPLGIAVVAPSDLGYDPHVEEDGLTFEANAIKKAEAGLAATGEWTIADDSGIEARALGWRPGVHSARYAGEACDDDANNRKLVQELSTQHDRYVQYRCVISLARPGAVTQSWAGIFAGEHIATPRGAGGFGYDPHVLIPALGQTVAELDPAHKHRLSHRGQALRACLEWLQAQAS